MMRIKREVKLEYRIRDWSYKKILVNKERLNDMIKDSIRDVSE